MIKDTFNYIIDSHNSYICHVRTAKIIILIMNYRAMLGS